MTAATSPAQSTRAGVPEEGQFGAQNPMTMSEATMASVTPDSHDPRFSGIPIPS